MLTVGLTGGSGCGKGYISERFAALGIPSLDTDKVSRQVCGADMPCTRELADRFGESILSHDGSLDRRALAAVVFSDPEALRTLNSVTHRYILAECERWLDERRADGLKAAIIDAPLLFESGFDKKCGFIVAVTAPRADRLRRIIARDGITTEAAQKRINSQHDDEFFRAHADAVIENGGSDAPGSDSAALERSINEVYASIIHAAETKEGEVG